MYRTLEDISTHYDLSKKLNLIRLIHRYNVNNYLYEKVWGANTKSVINVNYSRVNSFTDTMWDIFGAIITMQNVEKH